MLLLQAVANLRVGRRLVGRVDWTTNRLATLVATELPGLYSSFEALRTENFDRADWKVDPAIVPLYGIGT